MPTRLCLEARCAAPATYRGYCPEHARTINKVTHRNRHIYGSKRWDIFRRRVLFEQPLCPCGAIAVDVDHIQSLKAGGKPFSRANCQGLCKSCHSRKTRAEQRA